MREEGVAAAEQQRGRGWGGDGGGAGGVGVDLCDAGCEDEEERGEGLGDVEEGGLAHLLWWGVRSVGQRGGRIVDDVCGKEVRVAFL